MTHQQILEKLPYSKPFLFVDEIIEISNEQVRGCFTFDRDLFFYKGHFTNNPVTPGVILIETMAQIGVVCLGIYLLRNETVATEIALTSAEIEFLKPVFPDEKVVVVSTKKYFRFGKLKCKVEMFNEQNELVCGGYIAGMLIN